jgi:RNA polymerase sigma factor (sigma-70 family)
MATALGAMQLAASCSEEKLVAAVRAGDDRAFETLYARYRVRISAYILGMVHDHARAEDIAQDVFISALRGLRDTEHAIVFKPWLYEIAKNAYIDEFRRTRRAREVPLDGDRDDADGSSGPVIAGGATPDSEVETKQRLDDLRGAFHGLSESHHKIIVMRELAGLSYDEIGQRLGMSRPTVESTLFRARRKLGKEYDELVSGRRCERVQSAIEAGGERPLLSLGVRERRQVARHLSHCQPCRRLARMAGVDESFFQAPTLIGKIAALLPIPAWLRWRRSGGDGHERVGGVAGVHPAALQSMQVAARLADPAAPGYGLGRATATVAAIVLAGAGGGFVAGLGGGSRPAIRAPHRHVASAPAPSPKRTTGHTSAAGRVRRAASFRAKKSTVRGTGGGAGGHGGSPAKPGVGGSGAGGSGAGGSGGANGSTGSSPAAPSGSGSGSKPGSSSSPSGVTNRVKSIAGGAASNLNSAAAAGSGAVSKVTQTASGVTKTATNTADNTVSNVSQTASNVTSTATNTVNNTVSNVGQTASNATSAATNTVNNTVSNVSQGASNVTSAASNTVNNTVSTVGGLVPGQ